MTLEQTSRALDIFLSSLKTESTKTNYHYWLEHFMEHHKKSSYDDLIKERPEQIQTYIENYVMDLKRMRSTKSMVKANVYALFHFFSMNRVILNEKIIKKLIPEQEGKVGGGAYSTEDVRKIINAVDKTKIKQHKKWYFRKPRAKAIVHFIASSGIRLGALVDLKYGDIEPWNDCYLITIYSRTRYEYYTFITPEARKSLDEYLSAIETLTSDQPLFGMSYDSLRLNLYRLVKKAKVSTITITELSDYDIECNNRQNPRQRLDIPTVHGFRKRWNTILKSNKSINSNLIELMLGHTTTIKLDENYLKPTKEKLFLEFQKGIFDLTVFK